MGRKQIFYVTTDRRAKRSLAQALATQLKVAWHDGTPSVSEPTPVVLVTAIEVHAKSAPLNVPTVQSPP